jgi:glycosyltransferase involved in cell wall biosynthesis
MKICLLTPGQPSTNPRLVKEADALAAAGFEVAVVYADWAGWAAQPDRDLLATRAWPHLRVGGTAHDHPLRYRFTRLRHGLSRRLPQALVPRNWSLCRVTPELIAAARQIRADLYIAHNLGALPAAIAGARKHGALAGFDIEDLHSEMVPREEMTPADALAANVEKACVPLCDYLTAASPGIAEAYRARYGVALPTTILNVFPLEERPPQFRANSDGPLRLYWFSQTIGAGRGLEDAVRAMGLLGSPDIELYLQGQWAAGYRKELEGLASTVGVESRQLVHLPSESSAGLIRRAGTYDVGLALEPGNAPNNNLTISNKIFTYILAGNAIAATATAGQKPVVDSIAPAGICYVPGDVRALAGCLATWHRDRPALDAARRASWEWGTRRYNWNLEKSKFLGVIREAVCEPAIAS